MQLRLLVALLATATPLTTTLADPPDAPNKIFQGRDLFGLQYASDPQIRPDGRAVAYSRHSFDIMTDRGRTSIWLADTEAGTQTPVVAGAGSHMLAALVAEGRSVGLCLHRRRRPAAIVRAVDANRPDGQAGRAAGRAGVADLVARRQVDRVHHVRPRRQEAAGRSAAEAREARSGRRRWK